MERTPTRANLYPDLRQFYRGSLADAGSSFCSLAYNGQGLVPSAPPPSESGFSGLGTYPNLDLESVIPEEPELDYSLDTDLEPDYDMDDLTLEKLNNLNLNAMEKKILHDKNIEVPKQPGNKKDFRTWMTWRLQANKLLAAVILIRQGRHVCMRQSEIRRRPLTKQNVANIMREAKGSSLMPRDRAERTSLPSCPYIMYGIPRVKLSSGKC